MTSDDFARGHGRKVQGHDHVLDSVPVWPAPDNVAKLEFFEGGQPSAAFRPRREFLPSSAYSLMLTL